MCILALLYKFMGIRRRQGEAYVYVNTTRAVSVKQTPNKLVQGMMVHNLLFFFYPLFFSKHQIIGDRDLSKTRIPQLVKPTVYIHTRVCVYVLYIYILSI